MDRQIDERVARKAARQYGLITLDQARSLGMSEQSVRTRLCRGQWVRRYRGVFGLAGHAGSPQQAILAACLATGECAAASHESAGFLWGLVDRVPDPVHLVVPIGRRRRLAGAVTHEARDLERVDVTHLGPIPLTTPTRTLIDLAGVLAPGLLEDALDRSLVDGRTTAERLQRRIGRLRRRGRNGIGTLVAMLDERTAQPRLDSRLEARFLRMFRRMGLPVIPQYVVVVDGRRYVIDFAIPDGRVAIEIDGKHHASKAQWRADLERQNALTRDDWLMQRFTAADAGREDHVRCSLEPFLSSLSVE